MKHINLEQFAGGKLSVQLNKALEKITENVQDPNTDAQKVRRSMCQSASDQTMKETLWQLR